MKTKSLFIAALVVLSASVAAFGKEEPASSKGLAVVPVKGSEVFRVIYKGETAGKVKLNIYNTQSELVFTETINSTDGFIRPLNFSGLTPGDYTIELVDASGKKTEQVSYRKAAKRNVHISKLAGEDAKFLVAVAGTGSEVINVNIYDESNNLVHSESKSINGDFAQLYSLKNISGSLTFEVMDKAGNVKVARF